MIYRDTADLVSIYHSQLSCPALLSCSVHSLSLPEHGQALSYLLAHVVAIRCYSFCQKCSSPSDQAELSKMLLPQIHLP